jgi:23S rRNA (cytosine1962-C5)-methyltransferase
MTGRRNFRASPVGARVMHGSTANEPNLILFEDEHLLVINKPAGMNTHAPAPFAGEGIYDWLRHREPRWASLAILHRLDKETSGVMVFGKTPEANRSLTDQFTRHVVRKRYLLLTDRVVNEEKFTAESALVRAGEKYLSRPLHAGGDQAKTHFRVVERRDGRTVLKAEPVTGRTHQIRVHAAEAGAPILGDTLYGGSAAPRLCLHAASLEFHHPVGDKVVSFSCPPRFDDDARLVLRRAVVDSVATNAFRIVHGASDGWPGWQVDRLGDFLLSQSEQETLEPRQQAWLGGIDGVRGVYHKRLNRQVRRASVAESSPQLFAGSAADDRFVICENGVRFEMSFGEGYSTGLFLDQRDNRRRFLVNHIAAGFPLFERGTAGAEVLNAFAYTCGFSVCAAKAGARVTSLDLSKKYLEWGRRNFVLNDVEPAAHDFIYGDVFEWFRRLSKKGRVFDAVVLDPPTFSQSKEHGVFRVEKDYGKLVAAALPLLKPNAVLLASSNAAHLEPEKFVAMVTGEIETARRRVVRQHYVPQPPDFPISKTQPAYLKTIWLRVS